MNHLAQAPRVQSDGKPPYSNRGSALIITLGIVSVVSLAVILFVFAMRMDRSAARNARERAQARQHAHEGLVYLMDVFLPEILLPLETDNGKIYRTYLFAPPPDDWNGSGDVFQNGHVFGTPANITPDRLDLFANDILPLIPPRLTNDLECANGEWVATTWFYSIGISNIIDFAGWAPEKIEEYRRLHLMDKDNITPNVARIAGLVINCSGFLPAAAQTNLWSGADEERPEIRVFSDILKNLPGNLPDDLYEEIPNTTFHAFYDPNPYQYLRYPDYAGHPGVTNNVVNAVNLNAYTNAPVSEIMGVFMGELNHAGFQDEGYEPIDLYRLAQHYVNFTSTNRVPFLSGLDDDLPASRVPHAVNSLPLISQVILEEQRTETIDNVIRYDYVPHVLMYYPFAPNPSPPEIDLYLCVATNAADFNAAEWDRIPQRWDDTLFADVFPIPSLSWKNPFYLASANVAINFPYADDDDKINYRKLGEPGASIYIWPRLVYLPDTPASAQACVYDEALLNAGQNGVREWREPGAVKYEDPRFNLYAPGEHPEDRIPRRLVEKNIPPVSFDPFAEPAGFTQHLDSSTNAAAIAELARTLGAPWYFPNRPLQHAAELAYLFDDPFASTNILLGITQKHTAALVDYFTVIPPHITSGSPPAASNALTRVNPNSPYPDVLKHLLYFNPTDPGILTNDLATSRSTSLPEPFNDPGTLAELWRGAVLNTHGRGWNNYAQFLPGLADEISNAPGFDPQDENHRRLLNDLLVHAAPLVSFRQNACVVVIQAQRLSPKGRPLATQRAAFTVIRDAFTGQWFVYQTTWLTDK